MTFAYKVKSELCDITVDNDCCKKSELYGFLLFGRQFSNAGITALTEHIKVAATISKLLNDMYGVKPLQKTSTYGNKRISDYISIETKVDVEYLMNEFGHSINNVTLRLNRANIENECCNAAFMRGVFLSCGSIVDPGKDYHLEFVAPHIRLGMDLADFMSEIGFEPKTIVRKGNFVIYFKESEQIEDMLTLMGSIHCSLELMNIKVYKNLRNKVNRVTNCETANIGKTIDAAARQIEAINELMAARPHTDIPRELLEISKLRIDNPDASLSELAKIAGISRSGVNHRLQRILKLADKNNPQL